MAANQYGIDLADIYRTTTAVKSARTQNRLSDLMLKETEREIAGRPERERKEKERQNMLTSLRHQVATGDQNASNQLLTLDPEGGATFIEAVGKMNDRKREAAKRSVDEMGQLSAYVLQGKTPEEQQRRYRLMYQGVSPDVQAKLPEQYDPQFMEMSLSKAMAMDKILENPQSIQVGGEDVVYKSGREVERARRPVKETSPLVSVTTGGDKKESEKLAELRVQRFDEIQQAAIAAEQQIESVNQIKAIDLDTGLGIETRGQIAKVWDSLGGDGKALTGVDPSDVEKFKAVATKQVLDIMSTQKGPQTDQDAARIEKAVANLGNTKEANDFIMDSAIAIANRKIEQAAFMERYLEANGSLKGADTQWRDFKVRTPMVSDVVKNPETGAPVFFYQFREKMANRNYSDQDIIEAWRRMNARGQ
jgi:hypothetical protein